MSQSLLAIVGGILIDEGFRMALDENPSDALRRYGIVLNAGEHAVLKQILVYARGGAFDGPIASLRVLCPQWPCDSIKMIPYDQVAARYA